MGSDLSISLAVELYHVLGIFLFIVILRKKLVKARVLHRFVHPETIASLLLAFLIFTSSPILNSRFTQDSYPSVSPFGPTDPSSQTPHASITINGDSGFTASNGVTGGRGTDADPFVISNWIITNYSGATFIRVSNTSAFFVIQNVTVEGSGGGIVFDNVTNGRVLNSSSYQHQSAGIVVSSSKNIVLADDASSAGSCGPNEGCGGDGIDVISSNDLVVSRNYLPWTQGDALRIASSTNVTITGNRIGSSYLYEGTAFYGMHLVGLSNVTVSGNSFFGTGLFIEGLGVTPNTYAIRPDNTVNGKPLYYYDGCNSAVTLDQVPVGQLIIVNCSNVRLTNLKITNTDVGITMIGVKHALVENVNASSNHYRGISLDSSSDVTIKNVDISNMNINFFDRGAQDGLLVTGSKGIIIDRSRFGCFNAMCEDIAVRVISSINATISGNTFSTVGAPIMQCIRLSGSTQVRIFHNNFFQDPVYLCLSDTEPGHFWDNGYHRGGNFWSHYTDVDNCSGPQQNRCRRSDGIGDTPYPIPGGVYKDNYPLMKPFNSASIPLTAEFKLSPASPTAGQTITFTATPVGGVMPYTFNWNFGDGSTGSGSSVTHTYSTARPYLVSLTVTDSASPIPASQTLLQYVFVSARSPPLSASFTY